MRNRKHPFLTGTRLIPLGAWGVVIALAILSGHAFAGQEAGDPQAGGGNDDIAAPATRPAPVVYNASYDIRAELPRLSTVWGGTLVTDLGQPDETEAFYAGYNNAVRGVPYLILNVEQWPTDIRQHGIAVVRESIDRYTRLIEAAKKGRDEAVRRGVATAQTKIGLYSMFPLRDYWTPVGLSRANANNREDRARQHAKWQQANDVLKPLAEAAEVICPSLYTFYDDPDAWEVYAKANLDEAARYGKPVVPYLWPLYHVSNAERKFTPIGEEYLRRQIEVCQAHPDVAAVAIWDAAGMYGTGYRANPDKPTPAPLWPEQVERIVAEASKADEGSEE